jgi:hypothetical protein
MSGTFITLPFEYWENLSITKKDLDVINSYLFDKEIPSTNTELVPILIKDRIQQENNAVLQKQQSQGKIYFPKDNYKTGDNLLFPALNWSIGKVIQSRPGINPSIGEFVVIQVEFSDGKSLFFAANLPNHKLNQIEDSPDGNLSTKVESIQSDFGSKIESKLSTSMEGDPEFVRFAMRWFPKSLLLDISEGHLNLAEAILDEAGGKPLSTRKLVDQIDLSTKIKPELLEFSLNYALQNDPRFDEVGPTGEILWCLKRLEPDDVQKIPAPLRFSSLQYDRAVLTQEMVNFENQVDDELLQNGYSQQSDAHDVIISINYPHWRAGTLPISPRMKGLFPSAYESPRVRFTLIDGISNEGLPGWVVREKGYVVGLTEIYKKYGLTPGSLLSISKGKLPGQTIVTPKIHRPTRDWVRTVLVGSDGGIVFAMLKQNITSEFDERMVIAVPDVDGVDLACTQLNKQHLDMSELIDKMMLELVKLNVQGHVHALELYSAINIVRRCPPGPLLAFLISQSKYKHVGDLHFRLAE